MAQRRPRHEGASAIDAASILAQHDASTRRASHSSERAKRTLVASATLVADNETMFRDYAEAEAAIGEAAEEKLQIMAEIERREQELAEAIAQEAADVQRQHDELAAKREHLINIHRKIECWNTNLHAGNFKA